jgi:hypothetical protein
MLSPALILLSLFSGVALCKLYDNVVDLPGLKYDFVIVGGMFVPLVFFLILDLSFRRNGG